MKGHADPTVSNTGVSSLPAEAIRMHGIFSPSLMLLHLAIDCVPSRPVSLCHLQGILPGDGFMNMEIDGLSCERSTCVVHGWCW